MPLFCTLKNQFTGATTPTYDKFEDRGYPLMFETQNKHMFFVDAGDTTKTVHKFYGAPLKLTSVASNTRTLTFGSNFVQKNVMSVSDHNIIEFSTTYTLPDETTLSSYHEASCYSPTKGYYYENLGSSIDVLGTIKSLELGPYNLQFGQGFRVISQIDVEHHKVKARTMRLVMPSETTLSLGRSTSSITPKHGESFEVVSSLSVLNHKITPTYTTINLPQSYLYTSGNVIYEINGHEINMIPYGAKLCMKNDNKFVYIYQGNNISISSGREYNDPNTFTLIGRECGYSITISATNTHSVTHGAEMVIASASSLGKTINLTNTSSLGEGKTKLFSIIPGSNVSMEFNENNNDITISSTNSHYAHGITVTSGKSKITNNSSNIANLVTWQTGTANNVGPVYDIKVVSALPPDAGSHPNTLYLVTGGGG